MQYDAVVIGGGHNGLAAAACLGRAGWKVCVLERGERLGGVAAPEEFHPGYRAPGVLQDTTGFRRWVAEELELFEVGLRFREQAPALLSLTPDGPGLWLAGGADQAPALGGGDGRALAELRGFIGRVGGFLRHLQDEPPPDPDPGGVRDYGKLLATGLAFRRLGRRDLTELARVLPMCVADFLNERFESDRLKALMAAPALEAVFAGPWSAGTTANFLLHAATAGPGVVGGPAAVTVALEKACKLAGVELRTDAAVRQVRVESGQAAGVELQSGEPLAAAHVLSACDPRRTLLELVPPLFVSTELQGRIQNVRMRGAASAVRLALDGPFEPSAANGRPVEAARTAAHVDEIERAFDAAKYRRCSDTPWLEVRVPSVEDPALAPNGHAVVSVLARYTPHDLDSGWTDAARDALGRAVVAELERSAPGLSDRVVGMQVLAPPDLERVYGLTGGHLHHGEHALDQLLSLRPTPECAQYATPIPGLFLCGSGSHPGGGITGVPGLLGARRALRTAARTR